MMRTDTRAAVLRFAVYVSQGGGLRMTVIAAERLYVTCGRNC